MATVLTNREADPEVYIAIQLASACKTLRALPGPGGILDQDAYHMRLVNAGLAAFSEKERRDAEAAKNKKR